MIQKCFSGKHEDFFLKWSGYDAGFIATRRWA